MNVAMKYKRLLRNDGWNELARKLAELEAKLSIEKNPLIKSSLRQRITFIMQEMKSRVR